MFLYDLKLHVSFFSQRSKKERKRSSRNTRVPICFHRSYERSPDACYEAMTGWRFEGNSRNFEWRFDELLLRKSAGSLKPKAERKKEKKKKNKKLFSASTCRDTKVFQNLFPSGHFDVSPRSLKRSSRQRIISRSKISKGTNSKFQKSWRYLASATVFFSPFRALIEYSLRCRFVI